MRTLFWTEQARSDLAAIHADPCDRLIIATAERHDLPVVTADAMFARYGGTVVS